MKPITLHIPNYFDTQTVDKNRLILTKTKSLLKEDQNNAKFIASIENPKNYVCNIPEIGEKHIEISTNCFHRDRKENWELQTKVSGCTVYTHNWNDEAFHFRIYWIVISKDLMLQLVGVFEPNYSDFYSQHFMLNGLSTKIDTTFDFYSENNPIQLFEYQQVDSNTEELQELIDFKKQKEEKKRFLEENLKIANPNFYIILDAELKEKEEAIVENFMCTDWNMYYDLYNPENFSDPDSTIEWEDNSQVYDYYEKPFTDNTKVNVSRWAEKFRIDSLINLVNNKGIVEQNLLSFFEHYTFGNGGAYADAIHYQWAKIEIERLHNTTFTNQEFLKRNLCLENIIFTENPNELNFYFKCSWDTEHGIDILIDENFECKTEF
jgi:hypothetical protein